jgi:membrane-associated phospholipid phosphatase
MALVPNALRTRARFIAGDRETSPSGERRFRGLRQRYVEVQERHTSLLVALQLFYALLCGGWLLFSHTWPAPDIVALLLLILAFLAARGLSFLRDWSPFILLLLGYVALTGIANGLVASAHVQFPIEGDRLVFLGRLPTTVLQSALWNPNHVRWYDYLATSLYPMHFVVPLAMAFGFWMWKKPFYWRFVTSYLVLSYSGFVTYVLFPMAPPWWAANEGRIPPVSDILGQVRYGGISNPVVLATKFFRPNAVAAMPSIHAAVPVLVWLVLWKTWSRWGWLTVIYPLAMAFSVIYLGQHYFVDVVAGWLYAAAAYYAVWGNHAWRPRSQRDRPGIGGGGHAVPDASSVTSICRVTRSSP